MGFCGKAHGIKGGFTFILSNMEDSSIKSGSKIYLFPKTSQSEISPDGELFTISKISFGNKIIAYLDGVNERNDVDKMVPFTIKFPRDEFEDLENDEFYVSDLVNMEVYEHQTDNVVGKIVDLYDNGHQVIYIIKGRSGRFEIPFVDEFFPVVDFENGRIEIVVPRMI